MKLIDTDKGYEVLDKLFAKIQKNNYVTTQDMLDEAWKEWCSLPTAYDVEKVTKRLKQEKFAEQETILSDIHQGFNAGIEFAIKAVKVGGANKNR